MRDMESIPIATADRAVIGTIELMDIDYPFNYNIGEAKMVLKTTNATTELNKVKAVIENNNGKINLVSIVSKHLAVIPNQLIMQMIADVSKDLDLSTLQMKYTRNGYAVRIDLLSDRKEAVEVNDIVQYGVSIRNSIDGSTALAVDSFMYRLACRNGATAKIPNVTFNARHVGDANRLLEAFREALRTALEYCHQLIELYRRAAKIKVDKKIAERLVELRLPFMYYKYTPIRLTVEEHNGEKTVEIDVIREDTLWNTFNGITYVITHKSRANPIARSRMTHRLHRLMQEIVGEARI
jgi:Domain of unknown function (DUF932).